MDYGEFRFFKMPYNYLLTTKIYVMITSDNFRELVIMLDKKDLKKMLETNSDYIKLELKTTNCDVWVF